MYLHCKFLRIYSTFRHTVSTPPHLQTPRTKRSRLLCSYDGMARENSNRMRCVFSLRIIGIENHMRKDLMGRVDLIAWVVLRTRCERSYLTSVHLIFFEDWEGEHGSGFAHWKNVLNALLHVAWSPRLELTTSHWARDATQTGSTGLLLVPAQEYQTRNYGSRTRISGAASVL